MKLHASTLTALLAVLTLSAQGAAEPRSTTWLEEVRIEEPDTSETSLIYEYQATDFKAFEEGTDLVSLRLHAGMAERLEIAPLVRVRQRGVEPLQLHELGLETRVRVLGDPELTQLIVYGAYHNDTSLERDHRLRVAAAGRLYFGRLFVSGDVRPSLGLGGERDDAFELWLGLGAGFAFFPERELSAGVETFAIVPIAGERMSDPTFGAAAGSATYYYGPSLAFHRGAFWASAAAATSSFVSDGGSELLVRWMVGVGH
jgi:hypothetical protein